MFLRSALGAAALCFSVSAATAASVDFDAFTNSQVEIGPGTAGEPANASIVGLTSPNASVFRSVVVDFGAPADFISIDGTENTLSFASPVGSLGGLSGSVIYTAVSPFSLDALGDKLVFTVEDLSLDALFGPAMLTLSIEDSLGGTNSITVLDTFGLLEPSPLLPTNGTSFEILNTFWGVDTTSVAELRFDIISEPFGSITIGQMFMTDEEPGDPQFVVLEPSVIPLPAGVWLLGAGLGALSLRRKRVG